MLSFEEFVAAFLGLRDSDGEHVVYGCTGLRGETVAEAVAIYILTTTPTLALPLTVTLTIRAPNPDPNANPNSL